MNEAKAKRLEQLAQAREKALEKRRLMGEVTRQEKAAKEAAFQEKVKTLKMLKGEAPKETTEEDTKEDTKEAEPKPARAPKKPTKTKKVVKKVIEISDSSSSSSSDDSSSSDEDCSSDDEPKVKYIVRRKKKTKSKSSKPKGKKAADVDTSRLTAEVAKDLLKKRVMDDAQRAAFQSLFPYSQFT